jgi:hypothetical protein
MVWRTTSLGILIQGASSVKSAYKLGVMLRDRSSGREAASSSPSTAPGAAFDWDHICQLNVPTKIKMFVWRLAHNILANRMKISRLGVDLDTKCATNSMRMGVMFPQLQGGQDLLDFPGVG